jgi:hypothetical protein
MLSGTHAGSSHFYGDLSHWIQGPSDESEGGMYDQLSAGCVEKQSAISWLRTASLWLASSLHEASDKSACGMEFLCVGGQGHTQESHHPG